MGRERGVYILGGVSSFAPHPLWSELGGRGGGALQAALERGELEPLYGPALLHAGFEALARRVEELGLDLARVGSVELGLAYPRELCGLDEESVLEDFRRRLRQSPLQARLRGVRLRFRPTVSASSSGMVPFNDALGSLLDGGQDLTLVVAAGNVKGTRPGRARLSAAESSEILANLVSPLDRRLTGATMLKVAAVLMARACQQDLDLVPALAKHVREVRLSVHRRARAGGDPVHISAAPEDIADRVVCSPMHLLGIAPQSMGWAGLILGSARPESARAVRVLGAGAGADASSLRNRDEPLGALAMMSAMDTALVQARLDDGRRLWLFEAHNAFPGVFLAELRRVLELRGETGGVAECLLRDRAGALAQPLLVSPAGGALAGHPITATTVRLLGEAARQLLAGHPAGLQPAEGVSYGAVSAVGGPHCFDGFFVLGAGTPAELGRLEATLEPFDHDTLNGKVLADLAAEAARSDVADPGPLCLLHIAFSEPAQPAAQAAFALAVDARGRHYPCTAPPEVLGRLLGRAYVGTPVRLDGALRIRAIGPDALAP